MALSHDTNGHSHHEHHGHHYPIPHHSFFPGFADEFFHHSPFSHGKDPFDEWMPVLRNLERGDDHIIHHSSPGYEINEVTDAYQIAIDVPGVHAHDMNIQLENYGHVLHLKGKRTMTRNGGTTETKFEKRFRIGHNVDHNNITANLAEGVLLITAPKLKHVERKAKTISIRNNGEQQNPQS